MINRLFAFLLFMSGCFANTQGKTFHDQFPPWVTQLFSYIKISKNYTPLPEVSLDKFKAMLQKEAPMMSRALIDRTIQTISCTDANHLIHQSILVVIDYSLPSSQKRLWVFDLNNYQKLFQTYVSHGITSGTRFTHFFSNRYNSKATSIGLYRTEGIYYGRDGLSLRLQGLERGFNDNANPRYIVMHGGWYVEEPFIQKYGRAGRSWGCPALPLTQTKPLINTIKNGALLLAYYPESTWLLSSRFLNCKKQENARAWQVSLPSIIPPFFGHESMLRDPIVYADLNHNGKREEIEPVIAISANNYQKFFQKNPPLTRMLRRQIETNEYIVLNATEMTRIYELTSSLQKESILEHITFVVPMIVEKRGYYETQMKPLSYGHLIKISDNSGHYELQFDTRKPIELQTFSHFIRWIGL